MDNKKTKVTKVAHIAQAQPTAIKSREGWTLWGRNHQHAYELKDLAEGVPTHSALCQTISQIVAGEGIKASEQAQVLLDKLEAFDLVEQIAWDIKVYGSAHVELIYTSAGLSEIIFWPFTSVAPKLDDYEDIVGFYLSKDFNSRSAKAVYLPAFDPKKLQEHCVARIVRGSSDIFPVPDYNGALKWIKIAAKVATYHDRNISSGFNPGNIIKFFNGQPTEEEERAIKNMIASQSGEESGQPTLIFWHSDGEKPMEFQELGGVDRSSQYEFYDSAIDRKIFVAHRATSPLMFGGEGGGGLGSNADELRQADEIFRRNVVRPYRKLIEKFFNQALKLSGIPDAQVVIWDSENAQPTTETADQAMTKLAGSLGQIMDEYEIVETAQAGEDDENVLNSFIQQSIQQSLRGNGDARSSEDSGLYKLRYKYAGNATADSREFCVNMVGLSQSGMVWRREDIDAMSAAGENNGFAPAGSSSYDIFKYKGGVNCKHHWQRVIYMRKRDQGRFLPNDGLNNDKVVRDVDFLTPKGEEAIKPKNLPNGGKLN